MKRMTYKPSSRPKDLPQKLRAKAIEYAEKAKALAALPTETWDDEIEFAIDDVSDGTNLVFNVHASGENARIYRYVDEGTKTPRHAVMTRDFAPKTSVRSLASSRGRGGLAYVNKRISKPGIQARRFSLVVAETLQPEFSAEIKAILQGT